MIVSACAISIQVDVEFFAADGSSLGELQLDLEPFESRSDQRRVFDERRWTTCNDAFASVSSTTDGAAFFAYASVVDNGTNDPIFVPGR